MAKMVTFQGLRIHIETDAGETRSGVDRDGKSWSVTMSYPYGEIIGTEGVDGDPVDVFIGPNKSAKWVYVIHQTTKDGTKFDEDKCMVGFNDAMEAKAAFYKNYDKPDLFYGNMSTISVDDFKKRLTETKKNPMHIRASKIETTLQLYAGTDSNNPFKKGDQVIVDGLHGKGIVEKVEGRIVTVEFRSRMYVSRDYMFVHNLKDGDYVSRYQTRSV